jgi:CheY-like chemotaxis protein
LSNAVKYNRARGSITLSVAAADGRVRLSVADTGHGLTPDQSSSLFQPFNRLGAESTEVEGTGIGLAISKRIVEMMGGSIGVESTPGVGSTFWFELNATAPPERTNLTQEDKGAGNSLPEDLARPYTLLYVEDNPANLRLVSQLLTRRQDIKLVTAHTGTLGLEFALAYRPDIILLDINLPGMDGYQLKAELAQHNETRSTPVLALSANAMPRDIEKGAQAGFLHYLTKPIDIQKLMGAIDDVMGTLEPHDKILGD